MLRWAGKEAHDGAKTDPLPWWRSSSKVRLIRAHSRVSGIDGSTASTHSSTLSGSTWSYSGGALHGNTWMIMRCRGLNGVLNVPSIVRGGARARRDNMSDSRMASRDSRSKDRIDSFKSVTRNQIHISKEAPQFLGMLTAKLIRRRQHVWHATRATFRRFPLIGVCPSEAAQLYFRLMLAVYDRSLSNFFCARLYCSLLCQMTSQGSDAVAFLAFVTP